MDFFKMHGCGNDYVFLDVLEHPRPSDVENLARAMSDRQRGIGSDGLIMIGPSQTAQARMEIWNADGSRAEMCGNGIRCVAHHLLTSGIVTTELISIETDRGIRQVAAQRDSNGDLTGFTVDMGSPELEAARIPTALREGFVLDFPLECGNRQWKVNCVSLGNPHCVIFVDDLTDELLTVWGPQIENHRLFPSRVNVEFVRVISQGRVEARVWERGSGETMACGTGACAIQVVGCLTGRTSERLEVQLPGGILQTAWKERGSVMLTGPAVRVFSGRWPLRCGLQ